MEGVTAIEEDVVPFPVLSVLLYTSHVTIVTGVSSAVLNHPYTSGGSPDYPASTCRSIVSMVPRHSVGVTPHYPGHRRCGHGEQ